MNVLTPSHRVAVLHQACPNVSGGGINYTGATIPLTGAYVDLGFDGTPTGTDLESGFTPQISADNGSNWSTLDLGSITSSIVGNAIRYTLAGTINRFQGLNGSTGHKFRVKKEAGGDTNVNLFGYDDTLTNNSDMNLLDVLIERYSLADLIAYVTSPGNDLANNNVATFGAGKFGNCVILDESLNQSLSHSDNADFSFADDPFSFSIFANFTTIAAWMGLIVKGQWSGGTPEFNLSLEGSSKFRFKVWAAGGNGEVTWSTAPSAATWYHLLPYHDPTANVVGLSVDNATPQPGATTHGVRDGTNDLVFGGYSDYNAAGAFDGKLDEAALFSKVLSTGANSENAILQLGPCPWFPDTI